MGRSAEMFERIRGILQDHPEGLRTTEIAERLGRSRAWVGEFVVFMQGLGIVDLTAAGLVRLRQREEQPPAGGPVVVRYLTPEERARVEAGLPSDGLGPRWREAAGT